MTLGEPQKKRSAMIRWVIIVAVLAAIWLALAYSGHHYLTFKTIGMNYKYMMIYVSANLASALLIYMLLYTAITALSLPGGLVMTLTGGLLFGWKIGTPATVVAATAGATLVYMIAKSSFGEPLAARAGPWLAKLREGFKANALSYLLFLRLVPAFPFVIVNLAPALLGVPLRTYVIGTFLGIIPGTLAISAAGAGLGSVIEAQNRVYFACLAKAPVDPHVACPYTIDTSKLLTRELIVGLFLLGVVALIPIAIKKWSKPHAAA